jgi:hypothetical protein
MLDAAAESQNQYSLMIFDDSNEQAYHQFQALPNCCFTETRYGECTENFAFADRSCCWRLQKWQQNAHNKDALENHSEYMSDKDKEEAQIEWTTAGTSGRTDAQLSPAAAAAVNPSASGGTAGSDAQLSMACQTAAVATTLKAAVATPEATAVTGTDALVALLQDMDPGE